MTLTQWQEQDRRIKLIQRWLKASGWTPESAEGFDYGPIILRTFAEMGYGKRTRAAAIVDKARRLASGETIPALHGGRPREVVRKVSIVDMSTLAGYASTLADDMDARPGAYLHCKGDILPLLGAIQNLLGKYLA